jgi:predicted dehydrogenase
MQASRRQFLNGAAGSLAAANAADAYARRRAPRIGRILGANDRVNVAFIGCGIRFRSLARSINQRKAAQHDVETLAVCDVYEKHRERGKEATQAPDAVVDYQEILARDDIDGVIVAVPDHLHYPIAADAVLAGKDVYLEKPMTYTAEEADALAKLVKQQKRIMQIGVSGMYTGIYPAIRQYLEAGKLGKVSWASTSYCRNSPEGEWNYPIDEDAGAHNIDWPRWLGPAPKRRFSKERYFRWRKFRDYSGGNATDLLYHRLSPMVYMLGEDYPSRVTASGGIYIQKDREVPDNFFVNVEYPKDYTILLVSSMTNAVGLPTQIHGQYGTIEFAERGNTAKVTAERTFAKDFQERNDGQQEVTLQGEQRPDMMNNWLDAMRTRGATYLDADLGAKIMTAIKLSVDSYFDGQTKIYDPGTHKLQKRAAARPVYRPGDSA